MSKTPQGEAPLKPWRSLPPMSYIARLKACLAVRAVLHSGT